MRCMKKFLKVLFVIALMICIGISANFAYWWTQKGGEAYYHYTYRKQHEPFTFSRKTNTDSIYTEDVFMNTMKKYIDADESVLDEVKNNSFCIPGLKSTRTLTDNQANEISICTSMTPQGVVFSEDYIFISAYCCTKQHNSVIYMLDKNTKELIKEIVLPDKSHVGSLAYDSYHQNLWVCCYEETKKVAFVCALSISDCISYDFEEKYLPVRYTMQYQIDTQKRSSFMNYFNGSLYIGYFESNMKAETTIQEFEITDDGGLKETGNLMSDVYDDEPDAYALPASLFYINGNAQGMALDDMYIAITQSYGSIDHSRLRIFENTKNQDGNVDARDVNYVSGIDLPVMAEDCYMDEDGNLYICFESGAYAYRSRPCDHVDRIVFIPRCIFAE